MDKNYSFGPFHVDLATRQLADDGRPIPLTPKVFRTLEILLRNRDRIVSKGEFLSTIWPQSHVEEANLTQNISVVRRALGETNSATKFIATFPTTEISIYRNSGRGNLTAGLARGRASPNSAPTFTCGIPEKAAADSN